MHNVRIFEGNNCSRLEILVDAGTCPVLLVKTRSEFVTVNQFGHFFRFSFDLWCFFYGFITANMGFHDSSNQLMAGSIGVQTVGNINGSNSRIRRIQCAFRVQIDHSYAVVCADHLQRIHIVPKGRTDAVRDVIISELCSQNLAGSKAISVQRSDKDDLAGSMLGNQGGNNGIQRTVESAVLRIPNGTQGCFMAVVIGSHENDNQVRGGNILITVD